MTKRIYKITVTQVHHIGADKNTPVVHLVKSATECAAIKKVFEGEIDASIPKTTELADLMMKGVKVQEA